TSACTLPAFPRFLLVAARRSCSRRRDVEPGYQEWPMSTFVRFVLRHGRLVALAWLVVFLVGGATAGQLSGRLSADFSLPGQPGQVAEKELKQTYGTNSESPFIPVVTVPEGRSVAAEKARVGRVYEAIRQQVPGVRVVDFASTNDPRFLTED